MSDDYESRLRRLLAERNITTYRFEVRARHRAVVVAHGGRRITATFPSTGSDFRGARNAVADLRRALRLGGRRATP
jgi:hypothetical protein